MQGMARHTAPHPKARSRRRTRLEEQELCRSTAAGGPAQIRAGFGGGMGYISQFVSGFSPRIPYS